MCSNFFNHNIAQVLFSYELQYDSKLKCIRKFSYLSLADCGVHAICVRCRFGWRHSFSECCSSRDRACAGVGRVILFGGLQLHVSLLFSIESYFFAATQRPFRIAQISPFIKPYFSYILVFLVSSYGMYLSPILVLRRIQSAILVQTNLIKFSIFIFLNFKVIVDPMHHYEGYTKKKMSQKLTKKGIHVY